MGRVTVACVLRSGGETYGPRWVYALRRGLNEHLPDHRFVCLTDVESIPPMWSRPLRYKWEGWWSKLELFRPGLFEAGERVLYLDLDTLIVGDLSEIASYDGEFGMIRGFYRDILQSGVMAFRPGPISRAIWDDWLPRPQRRMKEYRGDGEYLASRVDGEADQLLDLYPGQIVSYKVHSREGIPDGARIVCGHGDPRFSSPMAGWAHKMWSSL